MGKDRITLTRTENVNSSDPGIYSAVAGGTVAILLAIFGIGITIVIVLKFDGERRR